MLDVRSLAPYLSVFDMAVSLQFYCDVLGCEVVSTDGKTPPESDWVMLRLNGLELMLNTAYDRLKRPPQPDAQRIAAHRDVCLYFGCPDVDRAYDLLQAKGLKINPPKIAWYGMKQLYVTDPDGYLLCFQWKVEEDASAT